MPPQTSEPRSFGLHRTWLPDTLRSNRDPVSETKWLLTPKSPHDTCLLRMHTPPGSIQPSRTSVRGKRFGKTCRHRRRQDRIQAGAAGTSKAPADTFTVSDNALGITES